MERSLENQIKMLMRMHSQPTVKKERPARKPGVKKPVQRKPVQKRPAWMGAWLSEDLNSVIRKVAGVEKGGLLVQKMAKGGPAEKAGLKVNDVLIELNGRRLMNLEGLRGQLMRLRPGSRVKVLVGRAGIQEYMTLRLGACPSEEKISLPPRKVTPPRQKPQRPKPVKKPKKRGYLGVILGDLDSAARKKAGIQKGGILVHEVVVGSPAEKAGLKSGDVLIRISGRMIQDYEDLLEHLDRLGAGTQAQVLIARDGVQKFMNIRLGGQARAKIPSKVTPAPRKKVAPKRKPTPRKPAWLGVFMGDDVEDRKRPQGEPLGLNIADVVEGGPAAKAGLRAGDIVLRVDGRAISGFQSLKKIIVRAHAGKRIHLDVRRGNRIKRMDLILGVKKK